MAAFKSFKQRLKIPSLVSQTQYRLNSTGGQKWDMTAIDRLFEELIDQISLVLDKVQVLGFRPLLQKIGPFKDFLIVLEQMETELLIQWKLKQERNLTAVFDRQRRWLSMEMRAPDGFFPAWNRFYRGILSTLKDRSLRLHRDPWKSLVLRTLVDTEAMSDLIPALATSKKDHLAKEICALFETLYNISPHHISMSFLSLIELGTGDRPEIPDPGQVSMPPEEQKSLWIEQKLLSGIIDRNAWSDMSTRLLDFWDKADKDTR